jgi:hypothetical protein
MSVAALRKGFFLEAASLRLPDQNAVHQHQKLQGTKVESQAASIISATKNIYPKIERS